MITWKGLSRIFLFCHLLFLVQLPVDGVSRQQEQVALPEVHLSAEEKKFLDEHPVIRFGTDHRWEPYVIKKTDGSLEGFDIDILQFINERTGADIQLVTGFWNEIVEQAKNREIDGLADSAATKERALHFDFTKSYFSVYPAFVVSHDNSLEIERIEDLAGKSVAILRGHQFYLNLFRQFPSITIIEAPTEADAIRLAIEGKATAAIVATTSFNSHYKVFHNLIRIAYIAGDYPLKLCYSIRKDWPELVSILDKALGAIPYELNNALYVKWFNMEPIVPREPESVLKTVIVNNYFPYTFVNEAGQPDGFSVDLIKAVAREIGMDIAISVENWSKSLELMNSGEVNVLALMAYSEERDRKFDFSAPYTIAYDGFFTRRDSPKIVNSDGLRGKRIIVNKFDQAHDYLKTLDFLSEDSFIYESDTEKALKLLASGQGDVVVMPKILGIVLIKKLKLDNLDIDPPVIHEYERPFGFAVQEGNLSLLHRLENGLQILDESGKFKVIHDKWLGEYEAGGVTLKAVVRYLLPIMFGFVVVSVLLVMWTVTLRRQVARKTKDLENEVLERERANSFLNAVLEGTTDAIFVKDRDRRYLLANTSTCVAIGKRREEIIGKTDRELFPALSADVIESVDSRVLETGKEVMDEEKLTTAFGETYWMVNKTPLLDKEGEIIGLIGISRNITERKIAEQEQTRLRKRLEALWNIARLVDKDFREICDYVLEQSIRITESEYGFFGFLDKDESEMTVHAWSSETMTDCSIENKSFVFPVNAAGLWGNAVRNRRSILVNDYEAEGCGSKKGLPHGHVGIRRLLVVPVFWENRIVSLSAVANKQEPYTEEDLKQLEAFLTSAEIILQSKQAEKERKNLEARLLQAQKMEAIGTLAGGIAHDFNNVLAVILGYAELAKEDAPSGSAFENDVTKILIAANRAKELIKQILAFSRQAQVEKLPMNIEPLVREGLKMLRSSIPTTIGITEDIERQGGSVLADPVQIQQILMNLCTNAYHAMEETGGTLSVSLRSVVIEPGEQQKALNVAPGKYIRLRVTDTGSGIRPDILNKIFDPYFTTKEQGKGTGMGLSIVHGIVLNCGGAVTVESKLGQGSTFSVYLPLVDDDGILDPESNDDIPTGRARILFVDDEELLADMGKDLLERLGYAVTVRMSGYEALETFQNSPNQFDLIITDQTMPGITGSDLARRVLQIRPDIPIILCTGHSNIIDEHSAKALGIREFVLKPLTREAIAKLISETLHSHAETVVH